MFVPTWREGGGGGSEREQEAVGEKGRERAPARLNRFPLVFWQKQAV